ncbi:hypothetical protein LguiB_030552 [Lonicera macranthoides]
MAKYNNSKNSESVCEKIRNTTLSPIFRKIRRISVHPQKITLSKTTPKFPLPTAKPTSIEIPIESSPQLLPTRSGEKEKTLKPHAPNNGQVIVTQKNDSKTCGPLKGQQLIKPEVDTGSSLKAKDKLIDNKREGGSKKSGQEDVNVKSSVYIDRMKNKMRAKSDVDGEKNIGRRDSFNDKVSNYIDRAKNKLRATSSIGRGK